VVSASCCTFGKTEPAGSHSHYAVITIVTGTGDDVTTEHLLYYQRELLTELDTVPVLMQCCQYYLLIQTKEGDETFTRIYYKGQQVYETTMFGKVYHQPPRSAIAKLYGVDESYIRYLTPYNQFNTWCCSEEGHEYWDSPVREALDNGEVKYYEDFFVVEFVDRYFVPNKKDMNPCLENQADYVYRPNPFLDSTKGEWQKNRYDTQNFPKCIMVFYSGNNLTTNNCAKATTKPDGGNYTLDEKNELIDVFYENELQPPDNVKDWIDPRTIVTAEEAVFRKDYVYYDDILTAYSYKTAVPHVLPAEVVTGKPDSDKGSMVFCANYVYWIFDKSAGLSKFDALSFCPITEQNND
jgi:hypothetical protein